MSKSSPCLSEVAVRMTQLPEFGRSYFHVLLYPPQPAAMVEYRGRQGNFSARMYGFYLQEKRSEVAAGHPVSESFLVWHRGREYDSEHCRVQYRGRGGTQVVACRYWYELTDGFWGQFSIVNLPHPEARSLLPCESRYLESMQSFGHARVSRLLALEQRARCRGGPRWLFVSSICSAFGH